jgi:hypothetical protein
MEAQLFAAFTESGNFSAANALKENVLNLS